MRFSSSNTVDSPSKFNAKGSSALATSVHAVSTAATRAAVIARSYTESLGSGGAMGSRIQRRHTESDGFYNKDMLTKQLVDMESSIEHLRIGGTHLGPSLLR